MNCRSPGPLANIGPGWAAGKLPKNSFLVVLTGISGIRPYNASMPTRWDARIAVGLGLLLAAACADKPSRESVEAELLEADRAFLAATLEDGLEGWLSFFTEDALRIDLKGPTVAGLGAIRDADAALFEPAGLRLRWEPTEAVAFGDGRSGITRGGYTLARAETVDDDEPEIVATGTYLTLWRRVDGRFKVYLDTGAPD